MSLKSAFAEIAQTVKTVSQREWNEMLNKSKERGMAAKDQAVQQIAEKKDEVAQKISAAAQEKLDQVAAKLPPQVVQSGAKLGSVAQGLTAKVDQVVPVSQTLQAGQEASALAKAAVAPVVAQPTSAEIEKNSVAA